MSFQQQFEKIKSEPGFIAALDQSGGSTPGALELYGISPSEWSTDAEMFDLVHAMRTRIMTSPSFTGEHILGAILFEDTMDREVLGQPTTDYLWNEKNVVPFLKVDKGLDQKRDGVQVMKPMPELDGLLAKAKSHGVFGTKMRSFIAEASVSGIEAVVAQQFEVARQILAAGLVPIIEPEVWIECPDKAGAEQHLHDQIVARLSELKDDDLVMLKLTIPDRDNLYADCIEHPNVVRVVALSGGYERSDANARLGRQTGMVASFSRALAQDLRKQQSDAEFDQALADAIRSIYAASVT